MRSGATLSQSVQKRSMANRLVASLLAAGCYSSALAGSLDTSLADYLAAKRQLSTQLRAAKAACDADWSQPREICLTEAMGNDWIAKADLEVAYRSTPRSRFEASAARADARLSLPGEQPRSRPCVVRAAEVRKQRRRGAP